MRSGRLQFAFRLAATIGCTVGELPGRISWDEWIEWQAWWELEPWGELRADMRQAAAEMYRLAPYLAVGTEVPNLIWPYWDREEPDQDEIRAAADEERQRWAEWESERLRKRAGGEKAS